MYLWMLYVHQIMSIVSPSRSGIHTSTCAETTCGCGFSSQTAGDEGRILSLTVSWKQVQHTLIYNQLYVYQLCKW